MQPNTNNSNAKQSKVVWIVVALALLTAGFAMMSIPSKTRHSAIKATQASPITTPAPAVEPARAANQPESSRQPVVKQDPPADRVQDSPKSPAAAAAEVEKNTSRQSCNCDTAETDLPDVCPNPSCHQCKVKCGIMTH